MNLSDTPPLATRLNQGCTCRFLDRPRLQQQLELEPDLAGLAAEIARSRPHLFSETLVFITPEQAERMAACVALITRLSQHPRWQQRALAAAPTIAQANWGPAGVFMGFDFHLGANGPALIEINTNAGGALLNRALAHAQESCCPDLGPVSLFDRAHEELGSQFLAMFRAEWQRQGRTGQPGLVVIVDEQPAEQYLYPEFLLCRQLLTAAGWRTEIADPAELVWHDGRLWLNGTPVDLVYNRLTDFYLEAANASALRTAHEHGAVVLTPHPRAHALLADKRLLAWLSDAAFLAELGLSTDEQALLAATVPVTRPVTAEAAEHLWAERRQWFFKPAAGFGSRATYRGDKLTKRVWQDILAGDYVAQRFVPPSERRVAVQGDAVDLKLDVRAYAYAGDVQLLAARLYHGQTTNFRTPGGGFAPVLVLADPPA